MEILAVAIIVLLKGFVDSLSALNHANAPIIASVENVVELPFGVAWNVSCKSNVPIVWKHHDPWFDWISSNVSSAAISTEDAEMQYEAVLSIFNASAASVGRYYCVPSEMKDEDLEEMETEDIASSVYVYVKDDKQPIVPPLGPVYYIQNAEVFIPCKPSYADVEVALCNKYGECDRTSNDPSKGFRLSKLSLKIPDDGKLLCTSDTASFVLHLIPTNTNNTEGIREGTNVEKPYHILYICIASLAFIIGIFIMTYYRNRLKNFFISIRTMCQPPTKYDPASTKYDDAISDLQE